MSKGQSGKKRPRKKKEKYENQTRGEVIKGIGQKKTSTIVEARTQKKNLVLGKGVDFRTQKGKKKKNDR